MLSHRSFWGCVLCGSSEDVSGDPEFVLCSALCWGFFFAFKCFSALSSIRSHSPRTKVSLSLLLSPHHSSNSQFPRCFGKAGLSVVLQRFAECVVMDVPYGRQRGAGRGSLGRQGFSWLGCRGGLQAFVWKAPSTSLHLHFQDLTWLGLHEPSLGSPACFQSHCFWFARGYFSLTASLRNGHA